MGLIVDLLKRKEFDRRVTSGRFTGLQAVKTSEGFCLIGKEESTGDVFMLQRTDKKAYTWKAEAGPSTYAQTRGLNNLVFVYREEMSVDDLLAGGELMHV